MARLLSCVILLAFAATTSGAKFQNGSFEQGSVPNTCNVFDLPAGSNVITGWTVSVGTIDWEGPPPCGWLAAKGECRREEFHRSRRAGLRRRHPTDVRHDSRRKLSSLVRPGRQLWCAASHQATRGHRQWRHDQLSLRHNREERIQHGLGHGRISTSSLQEVRARSIL